jgi:purine-binding chemotaxis protein CheW
MMASAAKVAATFEPPADGSWATFRLADDVFAVACERVHEIVTAQPVTPVPLAPPHVVGLLNLRGQVMPAIDLRRRLGLPARADGRGRNMVVLATHAGTLAMVVDAIGDVLEVPSEGWQPPPETLRARELACVFGIHPLDGFVLLGLRVDAVDGEGDKT